MSSRASECVHCEKRPTAAVSAKSLLTKYFADTRGETLDHAASVKPSTRTPRLEDPRRRHAPDVVEVRGARHRRLPQIVEASPRLRDDRALY